MLIYKSNVTFPMCDALDTMYPCFGFRTNTRKHFYFRYSTLYGYALEDTIIKTEKEYVIEKNHYFSIPIQSYETQVDGFCFGVFRLGFKSQKVFGELEKQGRLSYIDGCSDTLLVYPPRLGDPSLNFLHFPKGTEQTFHNHPSIRIGIVVDGYGVADTNELSFLLEKGDIFLLKEHEIHRFKTSDSEMNIIAFHPDGDWGPTDQNHTMLNRTYIK
jgi:quercetin dioxygenase-like cupin family protein